MLRNRRGSSSQTDLAGLVQSNAKKVLEAKKERAISVIVSLVAGFLFVLPVSQPAHGSYPSPSSMLLSFLATPGEDFEVEIPIYDVPAGSTIQFRKANYTPIGSAQTLTDGFVVSISSSDVTDIIIVEMSMSSPVFSLGELSSNNPVSWEAKLRTIDSWGSLGPTTISFALAGTTIQSVPNNLPEEVTSLAHFFEDQALSFSGNVGSWDVSNVVDMYCMFCDATLFNQDISRWNVSSVSRMSYMFSNATSFNQPIGNWSTSSLVEVEGMFNGATAFNQNLENWDVDRVDNMDYFFQGASAFNSSISSWDLTGVTSTRFMFNGASSFNKPLSAWNVSQVTDMQGMFQQANSFNQPLSSWSVHNTQYFNSMFEEATAFNQPLQDWNVSSARDMESMFKGAIAFNQPISSWDFFLVTDMESMFEGATSFNQSIEMWDVETVEDMESMFRGAVAFNQPLANWTVSGAIDMENMFRGAVAFNQPLSSWDVSSVRDMDSMFRDASAFNGEIGTWTVSSVSDFSSMFRGASSFNRDISNWDVSSGDDFSLMFFGSRFDQPLSWTLSSATRLTNMFLSSGLSCENYDVFLRAAAATLNNAPIGVFSSIGGGRYTSNADNSRTAITAKGWVLADTPCVTPPSIRGGEISGVAGSPISFTPPNDGGAGSFVVTPPLPIGLALNSSTGVISGSLDTAYSATHNLTVTNSNGTSSATVNIRISPSVPSDSGGNRPVVSLQIPILSGLPLQLSANKTTVVKLFGTRLLSIQSLHVGSSSLKITKLEEESIEFEIPAMAQGKEDLVAMSTQGKITIGSALEFKPGDTPTMGASISVRVFRHLAQIPRASKQQISKWNPPTDSVVCISYPHGPGSEARARALARATKACELVKPGVKTRVFAFGNAGHLADSVKLVSR